MANKRRIPPAADPAQVNNERILAQREERIIQQELAEDIDLGLNLKEAEPENAAEFLADEWDKKTFGAPAKTTTRVIYGPDPLVNNCPEFHDRLERYGQEEVASAFQEIIFKKGELGLPDPIMRKGVRRSIAKFGLEATAQAFYDRIMRIPARTVEIELDGAIDPLLSNPMRELVARYGQPGMAVKFLSDRCMDVLGKRGYEIVKDEHGDPVKCGTLYMGLIPEAWAERRRQHWAAESQGQIADQESTFYENAAKMIRDEGVQGATPLRRGESVHADPALNDLYEGDSRATGIHVGR